jgi:hypothetical protein
MRAFSFSPFSIFIVPFSIFVFWPTLAESFYSGHTDFEDASGPFDAAFIGMTQNHQHAQGINTSLNTVKSLNGERKPCSAVDNHFLSSRDFFVGFRPVTRPRINQYGRFWVSMKTSAPILLGMATVSPTLHIHTLTRHGCPGINCVSNAYMNRSRGR